MLPLHSPLCLYTTTTASLLSSLEVVDRSSDHMTAGWFQGFPLWKDRPWALGNQVCLRTNGTAYTCYIKRTCHKLCNVCNYVLLCICTGIHSCEYLLKKRGEDNTYMFFFTAKMLIWCIMLSLNDSNIINYKSSINQYVCAWNDHNNTAQVIRAHCWLNQEHTMKWGFWMSNFA